MPRVTLERSSAIEFDFTDRCGQARTVTIPAVSIGAYREALRCEAEASKDETPEQAQERLQQQALILVGEAHAAFVDELDPDMIVEVLQCLLSVYAGLDPAAVLEVQRSLKKKSLMQALAGFLPRSGSPSATS